MIHVALISVYDEFCLGLRHIGGFLSKNGYGVSLIHFKRYARVSAATLGDESVEGYLRAVTPFGDDVLNYAIPYTTNEMELLLQLLADRKATVVGLSVTTKHKDTALEIAKAIKGRLGVPVVWGGVHPTIAPGDCFDDDGAVDAVCLGEGEISLKEYAEAVERGADLGSTPIEGMWIRVGDRIVRNPTRPLESDLDSLGMQLFDEDVEFMVDRDRVFHKEDLADSELTWRYKIMTSRGCPFHCSFCVHSTLKKQYKGMGTVRRRSPASVIEELLGAKQRIPRLQLIEFEDDIFTGRVSWLREFGGLYKKQIGLPFWCYTYPSYVKRETLELLKDAGIAFISMGIESGSDRINFDVYKRKTSKREILDAVRLIAEYEIPATYDLLCCNPYETEEDLYETLDLLTQIPTEYQLLLGKLVFYPRAAITERAERDGLIGPVDEKRYRFWTALYLLTQYRIADRETILQLANDSFLREHPEILWSTVREAALTREERARREKAEATVETLKEQLRALEVKYSGLQSRAAVRYSLRLAEGFRKLVRLFRPRR